MVPFEKPREITTVSWWFGWHLNLLPSEKMPQSPELPAPAIEMSSTEHDGLAAENFMLDSVIDAWKIHSFFSFKMIQDGHQISVQRPRNESFLSVQSSPSFSEEADVEARSDGWYIGFDERRKFRHCKAKCPKV